MNILLISHYAGAPKYGMEFRSYYLGREWVRMGHKVMIVGASFSHLRRQQPLPGRENLDGIDYLWLPTRSYQGNGAARVLTMAEFVKEVYRHQHQLIDFRPDAVIASSVYNFDIYPCRHIARKANAKLIYEVHDLWPLSPMIIGGYSKWHPFIWLLQRGENYAYRHCDHIVSIPDKTFPHMQQHGLSHDRFTCIPNGFLTHEWTNPMPLPADSVHAQTFSRLHSEGKMIIGFAGGHTQSTAMHILIEAASLLRQRHDIAFVLVGQGPQKDELIAQARRMELDNVLFLPPVDKTLIPAVIQSFDICYAGGVHSILHQYGTSFNKVTDYMAARKPIIFSVDEPNSLVQRVGCGIQVEAENYQQVAEAITQLSALAPHQLALMGEKGHQYAWEHLSYTSLAKQFADIIKVSSKNPSI